MLAPERRTRVDIAVAAAIALVVIIAAALVWFGSNARGTTSSEAVTPAPRPSVATSVPGTLRETWRRSDTAGTVPMTAGGTVVSSSGSTVVGLDPTSGAPLWTYTRDVDLCSVIAAWNTAVAVYSDDRGCGQVTELDGSTGARTAQRGSDADDAVSLSTDGTYVSSRGSTRMEVWRSDLVRTLEYGRVDAPVNPGDQPRSGCQLLSTASSSSRVAVLEQCPGEEGPRLTTMNPAPKDNSKPEPYGSTILTDVPPGDSGARILAVAGDRIGMYLPPSGGAVARVGVFDGSSNFVTAWPLATAATTTGGDGRNVVKTGSVLAWWTGETTLGLAQTDLATRWSVGETLGAGVPMAGKLLVPVRAGLAVIDPGTGRIENTIIVDRGGYTGPVGLAVLGTTVLEQRGTDLVALA
ncbi:hypothetical protein GCM10007304_27980 [Rhodococcoides trifolii]|uniref:PQQ-binding-like beta-propeller repeat protein n=1 Tax=Rhodococcoides trifolii TaxID=908250 RepID=A0A917D882_9NOCA|nr:hypothetical protein [Rhodococcus trifolii]GGG12391.1 hypothetical protein GCM10007304_27980 [Rhodococcus trifolii]